MADLEDILASGDIPLIKENNSKVVSLDTFLLAFATTFVDGVLIPEISTANAENGSIYFDPDVGELRYKSPGGIALKFRMRLV